MVYIYYTLISPDFQCDLFSDHLVTLPTNLQTKIKRYRRWQDQQATLLGKLLLRKGFDRLNYKTDPLSELRYTSYGRPFIHGNIDFNISHSGNYVVCALSETNKVGIDIEEIKEVNHSDFRSQMTDQEWKRIKASPHKTKAFFDYWTEKEAVIKAAGKGLSIPLKSFAVDDGKTEVNHSIWFLQRLEIDSKSRCHLALDQKIGNKKIRIEKLTIKAQN